MNVLVIHGPTLSFLGQRPGDPPGLTLAEVDRRLAERARALGHALRTLQSNHEGALVDALWEQRGWAEGVLLNPGPLALGSHVLRAAVAASRMPVVEVMLAPAKGRAAMQRRSLLKDVCAAHVAGTGAEAYLEALERLARARGRAAGARITKSLGRAAAPVAPAPAARARGGKTLGPARSEPLPRSGAPAEAPRSPGPSPGSPATKTLGRAAPQSGAGPRAPGAGLTRAEVRARIADRLAGRLTPAGLATWARGEWVALQRGAAVEAGQRDRLEEVLQALFLAVQPRSALSDTQLVEWMAALE